MNEESRKQVEALISKAGTSEKSDDAMKFSQAACNAANALCALGVAAAQKHK